MEAGPQRCAPIPELRQDHLARIAATAPVDGTTSTLVLSEAQRDAFWAGIVQRE
jgi:hypothetical protein